MGDYLALFGDPRPGVGVLSDGVPDIAWCPVDLPPDVRGKLLKFRNERGQVYGQFMLEPYYVARYPVTFGQFRAFLESDDGFQNPEWWAGMPAERVQQAMYLLPGRTPHDNQPRDTVSWFQAVAFTGWLNARLHGQVLDNPADRAHPFVIGETAEVRLPLEWEWQWAAGGMDATEYSWGAWDERCANTRSARLGRTTAVGMYPHAASWCGALDMSGGVWEWCLNEYQHPSIVSFASESSRVLRGGSFVDVPEYAVNGSRFNDLPNRRLDYYGLRVVCAPALRRQNR
ncbi:MAG: SUMF1/EgtB/PvdO family nonheme iron enzyme [bacterium]|nr:SUMF1/EgtB/PvdO family nonheme iron enzyme [bacterium]